jgi:septum formation protein
MPERSAMPLDATFGLWLAKDMLILASASSIRARMLRQAGIPIDIQPAPIDERALEAQGYHDPAELATILAEAKAVAVSKLRSGRLVLGADQVLALDGEVFHKAPDRDGALAQLARLSGRRHRLHAASCLARDGRVVARQQATASLTMRKLSPDLIEAYVAAASPAILASVGCYQIEALGIQLFDDIEGDHFTIQGLPLLPLLDSLRSLGMLAR